MVGQSRKAMGRVTVLKCTVWYPIHKLSCTTPSAYMSCPCVGEGWKGRDSGPGRAQEPRLVFPLLHSASPWLLIKQKTPGVVGFSSLPCLGSLSAARNWIPGSAKCFASLPAFLLTFLSSCLNRGHLAGSAVSGVHAGHGRDHHL